MAGTGKIHVYYGHGKGKTTAAVGARRGSRVSSDVFSVFKR